MVLELNQTTIQTVEVIKPGTPTVVEVMQGLKGDPGTGGSSDWSTITGKPSTFTPSAHTHPSTDLSDSTAIGRSLIIAASQSAARTAIGAGTSSLVIGTTSTTAKAGDWVPAVAEVTGLTTALAAKAPLASPTFTGTVAGITAAMVGLGNVPNTDATNATNISSGTLAIGRIPTGTSGTTVSLGNHTHVAANITDFNTAVDARVSLVVGAAPAALDTLNELAAALGNDANFATTVTNSLALKAPLASPTFTGTVSGITKSMVGLGSVDNTADTAKPVSTAQQTALNLKANLASPTFTGTVTVPDGSFTIAKTTGLQTALDGKVDSVNGSTGTVILDPSDIGASPVGHTHLSADITDLATGSDGANGATAIPAFTTSSIATGTGTLRWYNDSGRSLNIVAVRVVTSAAPTGSSTIIDVNVNGTTIWGTQSNRTTLTATNTTAISTTINSPIIANGQYVTVDIDQIGTFAGGTTLTVFITAV